MRTWKTLLEDEIWTMDNFFPEETVNHLLEKSLSTTYSKVGGTDISYDYDDISQAHKNMVPLGQAEIFNRNNNDDISQIRFEYNVYGDIEIRKEMGVRETIANNLEKMFPNDPALETFRSGELYPLQLFMKSHSPSGHYSIHTEGREVYGEFAFICFLDEVDGCNLVFPSKESLPTLFEKRPHWKKPWDDVTKALPNTRYLQDIKYKHKRNQCILFRMESAHYVSDPEGEFKTKPGPWRHCVTGWPWESYDKTR